MAKDIQLDSDGDLKIENGDFVIGDSDLQDVQAVFLSFSGEFKEFPLLGFGASKYLKKTNNTIPEFVRELELQLEYNGFEDPEIDLSEGLEKLKINV